MIGQLGCSLGFMAGEFGGLMDIEVEGLGFGVDGVHVFGRLTLSIQQSCEEKQYREAGGFHGEG